jgi:hypothetical protein
MFWRTTGPHHCFINILMHNISWLILLDRWKLAKQGSLPFPVGQLESAHIWVDYPEDRDFAHPSRACTFSIPASGEKLERTLRRKRLTILGVLLSCEITMRLAASHLHPFACQVHWTWEENPD